MGKICTVLIAFLLGTVALAGQTINLAGTWLFNVRSSLTGAVLSGTGTISQNGTSISGSVTLVGNPCAAVAPISGVITGTAVALDLNENGQISAITALASSDGSSIQGTYIAPTGGCTQGDYGVFGGVKTGTPVTPGQFQYSLTSTGSCSSSFYVATANLQAGQSQGVYSMIVSVNQGLLAGGFNLGGGFGSNGTNPGFGQFQTASTLAPGTVSIQIGAQPLGTGILRLIVTVLNASSNNATVYTTNGLPPLSFTTPTLTPGNYYTVQVSTAAGSPSGTFQMSMATASGLGGFQGGVVAGGMAISGVTGYGAFCLPISQTVNVQLQTGSTFGTAGSGNLTLVMQNQATGQVFPHN
jgi:hypothetical protein